MVHALAGLLDLAPSIIFAWSTHPFRWAFEAIEAAPVNIMSLSINIAVHESDHAGLDGNFRILQD